MKTNKLFKSIFKSCVLLLFAGKATAQCSTVLSYSCSGYGASTDTLFMASNWTPVGSNITWDWVINGQNHTGTLLYSGDGSDMVNVVKVPAPPSANSFTVELKTYSGGVLCNTIDSSFISSCQTAAPSCSLALGYTMFELTADPSNPGEYSAYITSPYPSFTSANYLWDFGDGTTSTQQYPVHQYTTSGQYVVCLYTEFSYTNASGTTTCQSSYCDSSSVQKVASSFLMNKITIKPKVTTSIQETGTIKGFNAYPNPLTDELNITIELSSSTSGLTYTLYDALGKIVMKDNFITSKTIVNTSTLNKGFYFLSVSNDKNEIIKTVKLVK